jgi:N4-gp56 family major capsid protein
MAINLAEKYSAKVAERFHHKSYTAGVASDAYDFDGVKSIKVYSIDTVPLTTYSKAVNGFTGSRYGTPADLTDSFQTLTMTQDRSFTYIIDKGDDKNQLNIKKANRALTREIDERVTPELDKYNLTQWVKNCGQTVSAASITKSNALELVQDATEALDELACPDSGRTLIVTNNFFKLLKQNANFVYTEKLAQDSMVRGKVGELDGMIIRKVPNSYLPSGVVGMVVHRSALLAPMKLKEYKIHTDPPGINGNLTEGRIMHDAFVLDAKADAIVVICTSAAITNALSVSVTSHVATISFTAATGDKVFYTVDGTDPRCSGTATAWSSGTITLTAGQTIKVAAYDASEAISWKKASGDY